MIIGYENVIKEAEHAKHYVTTSEDPFFDKWKRDGRIDKQLKVNF